jgi:hypothetical protein
MACAICEIRRPKRHCPGVNGDICAICCGTEREVTVDCPYECEYLQEARKREYAASSPPGETPNGDIEVTERLIQDNAQLLDLLGAALLGASREMGAIDADAREALDALVRTYRTLESGVYYDTRPAGSFAAAIYDALQNAAREYRSEEQRRTGVTRTRDADVLGLIVFLQRIERDRNNGRPRGRAFLDSLQRHYVKAAGAATAPAERSSLILP